MNPSPETVLKQFRVDLVSDDTIRVCLEDSLLIRELLDELNDIRAQLLSNPEHVIYLTRA